MAAPLTKVSLRNVAAHKVRLALTVVAVVLGTAFLSGALMFTNMLSSTFDSAVDTALGDVDAVVRPGESDGSIARDEVDAIRADGDVARVNLYAELPVVVATQDEVAIQTQRGTSRLGLYYGEGEAVGRAPSLIDGSAPHAPDDIAVNANGAARYGIGLGDRLIVVDKDGRHEFTVTGLYDDPLAQETSLMLRVGEDAYIADYTNGERLPAVTVRARDGVGAPEVFLGAPSAAGNSWRRRRATGASMVEEADRTNSPMSCSFCRTTLLGCPSSLASSWTRTLATFLLSRSGRQEGSDH